MAEKCPWYEAQAPSPIYRSLHRACRRAPTLAMHKESGAYRRKRAKIMSTRPSRTGKAGSAHKAAATSQISRRLSPEARRSEIVQKAVQFFAEKGFESGTRDLANYLNITQPLLYRYFPTKEDLIKEVYQTAYLDVWRGSWDELLVDRSRPLVERLQHFYTEYTDVIMNEDWMRIYFFAALRGAEINKRYIKFIEERILKQITREFLIEFGAHGDKLNEKIELEHVWHLQSAIFYYGVRRFVYKLEPDVSKDDMINDAIEMFVSGYRSMLLRRGLIANGPAGGAAETVAPSL
jgi:AcrR family transcriptional regulator